MATELKHWKRFPSAGGFVYVLIQVIAGVKWTAKLIPSSGPLEGWVLRIWRESRLVDEQGAQLPGRRLGKGKRAAVVRVEQLAAGEKGSA